VSAGRSRESRKDWEQATSLWYYQQVEGLRPDVEIVYPIERLEAFAVSGRPLYVARALDGLSDRWHLSCSDSLIALRERPLSDLPPDAGSLGLDLATEQGREAVLRLAGYRYGRATFAPGSVVPLTLYWQAVRAPVHDYSVSLRVFGEGGGQVYQVDSLHPVLGVYPTSRWTEGEVVADYYEIQLSPALPDGMYEWGVVVYRARPDGGWESLRVVGTGDEVARGATFTVR